MEGSNELRQIKKEIIEARSLIIKSNNLANGLSAEVKSIAKRQASYERTLSFNSVIYYVVVAVVCWGGIWLAYDYRHTALEQSRALAQEEAAAAKAELAKIQKKNKPTKKGGSKDIEKLYRLVHEAQRQEAIDAYKEIDLSVLSDLEHKLITDAIEGFKIDLSMQHYSKGLELNTQKQYAEAETEFRKALQFKGDAGHAKAAKLQLANSLRLQGRPREAIAIIQRLVEEHLDRDLADDAYWYLALSHNEAHQKDEAYSVLRSLMRQFPDSQYFRLARIKSADIRIHMYSGGKSKKD